MFSCWERMGALISPRNFHQVFFTSVKFIRAGLIHQLTAKARSTVRDIDPTNDLTFLRIRSKKHEIMVTPEKEYMLIVIQNPASNDR